MVIRGALAGGFREPKKCHSLDIFLGLVPFWE